MDICELGLLKDRNNRIKLYGYIKEDMASLKKFMVSWMKTRPFKIPCQSGII